MSGIQMALLGVSGFLDQQTITTGGQGDPLDFNQERGFVYGSFGSCNDGTSNIYSDALIVRLEWREEFAHYIFNINGVYTNTGWTTLTIVGNGTEVLTRASASFTASGSTSWIWSTADDVSTQVFGSISSTAVCTFT